MSRRGKNGSVLVVAAVVVLIGFAWGSVSAAGRGRDKPKSDPRVFTPNSHPYGQTYGEWVAAFWQYALAQPFDGHPFRDTPEYDFARGQTGRVWFWSAPDGPITREVTIPEGVALFLTVRDVEVSDLEEPPFFGETEAEQRAMAKFFADHIVDLSVTIDGRPVADVEQYRFESPQFEFTAPTPWIFGNPETGAVGGEGTAVGDGYYMMIKPLSRGQHVIEYSGTLHFDAGEFGPAPIDLPHSGTIILNVVKQKGRHG